NINLCPAKLHQYTREDGGALTQYGDYCYELVPIKTIWSKAERDCMAKGGDLFHVDGPGLQDYIYRWIKSYNFDHAVWMGLHDVRTEENFEWISGDHVIYLNWYSDRKGNLASHYNEDCVLFVPYAPYYGKWDDVICGSTTLFGDIGQQNPFICEYSLRPHHVDTIVG
ncbi:snaclec coagulation factor IX-binding protein subunit A-like, partial [Ruditapes philippinarum]|uniref:snaclec coagulation factor IX-binding protein subunit A-like n=1 Tax=Ruditapes philippinarum TaxID=129788 RepID=UPI00295B4A29